MQRGPTMQDQSRLVTPNKINQFTSRVALSLVGPYPFSHSYTPASQKAKKQRSNRAQKQKKQINIVKRGRYEKKPLNKLT